MKIKFLKALPWVEIGEIHNSNEFGADYLPYDLCFLIKSWWAEEVKEEEVFIPDIWQQYLRITEWKSDIWERLSDEDTNSDYDFLLNLSKLWLIFKTEAEAKKRLLFLELSNSNDWWIPEPYEDMYMVDCLSWGILVYQYTNIYLEDVALWICYKTKEQAEKWAPKWKEYFDLLTK